MTENRIVSFVEKITPTVLEAGHFALESQGTAKNIGKDDEESNPSDTEYIKQVKQAKTIIDEQVQEKLLIAAHSILGTKIHLDAEEDTPSKKLFSSKDADITLVIDPIDGTLQYLNGSNAWTVCIALLSKGEVLAALVYFPSRKTLYLLDTDAKSYICECNESKIISKKLMQSPKEVRNEIVYVNHRVSEETIDYLSKRFTIVKYTDAIVSWAQALLKCVSGEYEAIILAKPQIRDVLLGAVIERMSGGYAVDFTGKKILWPNGGRIPEVVFGFGILSDEIKNCLS